MFYVKSFGIPVGLGSIVVIVIFNNRCPNDSGSFVAVILWLTSVFYSLISACFVLYPAFFLIRRLVRGISNKESHEKIILTRNKTSLKALNTPNAIETFLSLYSMDKAINLLYFENKLEPAEIAYLKKYCSIQTKFSPVIEASEICCMCNEILPGCKSPICGHLYHWYCLGRWLSFQIATPCRECQSSIRGNLYLHMQRLSLSESTYF